MFKVVQIGENEIPLLSNGATPFRYKQLFGGDLMKEFNLINETEDEAVATNMIAKLAFVMNQAAEKADMNRLNEDMFFAWLERFESLDLSKAGKEIMGCYIGQIASKSKAKNQASQRKGK